jgi:hypothetical protein
MANTTPLFNQYAFLSKKPIINVDDQKVTEGPRKKGAPGTSTRRKKWKPGVLVVVPELIDTVPPVAPPAKKVHPNHNQARAQRTAAPPPPKKEERVMVDRPTGLRYQKPVGTSVWEDEEAKSDFAALVYIYIIPSSA